MATFGEISEPTSRAVWEDLEIDSLTTLEWQKPFPTPEEVGKFFIFEGKCLWSGVKARKGIQEVNTVKEANLHLYKIPNNNNYVVIVKDCDLPTCNAVVTLLKDWVTKASMIVTIQEKPMAEYHTEIPFTGPHLLRKITTTNESNLMKIDVSKLEQPNIVTGVSAGVFSLREHLGLSATSMVFFQQLQEDDVDDIENLMKKMDMSGTTKVTPDAVSNSNLYT